MIWAGNITGMGEKKNEYRKPCREETALKI